MDVSALYKQRSTRPVTHLEAYDELLGAYDRALSIDTGLHGIAMSDFENPLTSSLLEIWMETYARERVYDIFHIDFDVFLDRPRWELQMMLRTCARVRRITDKLKDDVASQAELLAGKGG